MKRFLRSRVVLTLAMVVLLSGAIFGSLAGNVFGAHAQAPTVTFTKAATPKVAPGGTVDYTLTLTNTSPPGTIELHDIHITDILPSPPLTAITKGPTFTITPPTGGGFGDCNGTSGLTVACTVDNLAPGSVVTITFSASVSNSATGTITNTATAKNFLGTVNETATANTTITVPPPTFKTVALCGLDLLDIFEIGKVIHIAGHSVKIVKLIVIGVHGVLAAQDLTTGKRIDAVIEFVPLKPCVDLLLIAFPEETREVFDQLLRGTIQAAIDSLCEELLLPPTGKFEIVRDLCKSEA